MTNKTIALVGQPNSGKSTLFGVLSDINISSSLTTVEIQKSKININGDIYHLIDLPGIYSLNPSRKVEKLTYDYLLNSDIDLIINIVDSTLLSRSIELSVELLELGIPMVIALNMQDEAERHGIKIDAKKLENILNVPVVPTVAVYGKGLKDLVYKCSEAFYESKYNPTILNYTYHLDIRIKELEEKILPLCKELKGCPRFYSIKSIENPEIIPQNIILEIKDLRNEIERECVEQHRKDCFETISYERHHLAMKIAEEITTFVPRGVRPFVEKLDDFLLHPIAGYFFLAIFFILYFFSIFIIGELLGAIIEPPISHLSALLTPLKSGNRFLWFTLNGAFQGFAGAIGVVLPYFLPLVFLTSLFEESGYIARIAFLIDSIMHKIGLHGKSVVPFILGFGCSVPAIYATRILENKRDRMITGILIPFIPCSARISVIFALTAAFTGPVWAMIVFIFVIGIIAFTGKIMTKFLAEPLGLILEIPRLKLPSLKGSTQRTWMKIREFLRDAVLFLILGGIILGWIEYFNAAHYINIAFAPLVKTILGLPEQLGSTLLFGFFRKELIIVMAYQSLGVATLSQLPMTIEQVIVFIIFVTLYFPCLTTFIVIWKEFGVKVVTISSVLSIFLAIVSAFLFKILLSI